MKYFIVAICVILSACTSVPKLTKTPTVYAGKKYPEQAIPKQQRTTQPEIYYITDRLPTDLNVGGITYSSERSPSMVFGKVKVSYGENSSWAELVESSNTVNRKTGYKLQITSTNELIKFPPTPLAFTIANGKIVPVKDHVYRTYQNSERAFTKKLSSLFKISNGNEVVLFIHGFKNDFDDAAYSMADVWHFSGRIGVPIFFTWPAGAKGAFGYFKDRESGEYAIYHLKETLRMIAATPGLKKVHIIAHSRGTDVATTALRELMIETRAAGQSMRKKYKIENLILAAPDLDFGVVRQRLIAEKFGPAFGQINVYMNQNDSALGLAQKLMAGERFGRLTAADLDDVDRDIFASVRNVSFIDIENQKSLVGHSYFKNNPGVLSDIALTLQTSAKPGSKERPLLPVTGNFWRLSKYYPYDKK
jgi:esterase/lipase superfamily enzyme